MNAATRLIYSFLGYKHVTLLLHQLHWLKVPCRIDLMLAVLTCTCLHGLALAFVTDEFHMKVNSDSCQCLQSNTLSSLHVLLYCFGDRAFLVAATDTQNSLPQNISLASSLPDFTSPLLTVLPMLMLSTCTVTRVILDTNCSFIALQTKSRNAGFRYKHIILPNCLILLHYK